MAESKNELDKIRPVLYDVQCGRRKRYCRILSRINGRGRSLPFREEMHEESPGFTGQDAG